VVSGCQASGPASASKYGAWPLMPSVSLFGAILYSMSLALVLDAIGTQTRTSSESWSHVWLSIGGARGEGRSG